MAIASVQIVGARKVQKWIRKWDKLSRDRRPIMKLIGHKMIAVTQDTFRNGTDPKTGAAWPKTSAFTIASRVGGTAGKTLVDEGLLRQSLSTFELLGNDGVRQVTNRPGAALNFRGGTVRPVHAKRLAIPKTALAKRLMGGGGARAGTGGGAARAIKKLKAMGEPVNKHFVFAKSATIPRRRFLGMSARHVDETAEIVAFAYRKTRETGRLPSGRSVVRRGGPR